MRTKMFSKKQSPKEQKLTELSKILVTLITIQDFLENPHAVQKLSQLRPFPTLNSQNRVKQIGDLL